MNIVVNSPDLRRGLLLLALTFIFGGSTSCGKKNDVSNEIAELRKHAEKGIPEAQYNLSLHYFQSNDGRKDEALHWLRKAAEQGLPEAQYNLAVTYTKGEDVVKNEIEAAKWAHMAAQQGDPDAQFLMGVFYATGIGVEKNEVESYKWILLAHAQGSESAKENISDTENTLSLDQRAEGQRRAAEWQTQSEENDPK